MSEEIALAAADVAFWRQRAEQSAAFALTLQAQRDRAEVEIARLEASRAEFARSADVWRERAYQAEADALALRDGICRYAEAAPDARGALYHRLFVLTVAEHPGASLLAELAHVRAIVTALRMHRDAGGEVWHSIDADLAAYDKAVKARAA